MKFIILSFHFLLACVFTFVTAVIFHSQTVLNGLSEIGISISISDRLYMLYMDLIGLAPSYFPIICFTLLLAFSVAALISSKIRNVPSSVFLLAGSLGMLSCLMAMHPILDVTLLASARSSSGIILQMIAGALGAMLFITLRKTKAS